jgi:hypothetical protein
MTTPKKTGAASCLLSARSVVFSIDERLLYILSLKHHKIKIAYSTSKELLFILKFSAQLSCFG